MTLTLLLIAVALGCAAAAWSSGSDERRRSAARVAALASALGSDEAPVTDLAQPVAVASLFADSRSPGGSHRWSQVALAVILAAALGGVTFLLRRPAPDEQSGPAAGERATIELMSMRHVAGPETLTVTGLVRNPPQGPTLTGIEAVVFGFDRAGEFVTSGNAPIGLPIVRPGEESPFSVTLSGAAGTSRYRVSFRTRDGILPHVDARAAARLAGAQP